MLPIPSFLPFFFASVLYDAPDKEEASKIQAWCCVPRRGFCCLLGLVFMLLSIVTGWIINHSKLDQLKQQLSSLEENNLLLEKLIEMVQGIPGRVDYLMEQDQQLRERLKALDEAKLDIQGLQNASLQIDALQRTCPRSQRELLGVAAKRPKKAPACII